MATTLRRLSLRWIALGIGVGLALMTCRPAHAVVGASYLEHSLQSVHAPLFASGVTFNAIQFTGKTL